MSSFFNWIGTRLNERSSWLGLTAMVSSAGATISPDLQNVIIQIGVGVGGLIAFFTRDKTKK